MYTRYAEIRDTKGLTDAKVAAAIGVNQSVISDWKRRCESDPQSSLSFESMMKIAELFDVDASEFRKEE